MVPGPVEGPNDRAPLSSFPLRLAGPEVTTQPSARDLAPFRRGLVDHPPRPDLLVSMPTEMNPGAA